MAWLGRSRHAPQAVGTLKVACHCRAQRHVCIAPVLCSAANTAAARLHSPQFWISFYGLPDNEKLRSLRSNKIGKLTQVRRRMDVKHSRAQTCTDILQTCAASECTELPVAYMVSAAWGGGQGLAFAASCATPKLRPLCRARHACPSPHAVRLPPLPPVCGHGDAHHGCAAGALHRHLPLHGVHDGCVRPGVAGSKWGSSTIAASAALSQRPQPYRSVHSSIAASAAVAPATAAASTHMPQQVARVVSLLTCVCSPAPALSGCAAPCVCSGEGCGAAVQVHTAGDLPQPHLRQQVRGQHGAGQLELQGAGGSWMMAAARW